MRLLKLNPSLVEQAYDAILDEICDGTLASNSHLVQEALAARLGVSRQPIQQALLLLKNDGVIQDAGRRGLIVAPLDPDTIRHRYQVRAALDALAARLAAQRCATSAEVARHVQVQGEQIITRGLAAVQKGSVKDMIASDVEFHAFIYMSSGNPVLGPTAQRHWPYLRRLMGEVLRHAAPPPTIWQQHRAILESVVNGDADRSAELALQHIEGAAERLASGLTHTTPKAREI